MSQIKSIHHVKIGREYRAVVGLDGLPALELVERRGRPRSLTGEEVIAARALKNLGHTQKSVAKALRTSVGAVRTATGAPR